MAESISDGELLHECAGAFERLLSSPDLHLDSLEPETIDAIDHAYRVLQKINARRQAVYCVLCGDELELGTGVQLSSFMQGDVYRCHSCKLLFAHDLTVLARFP
jgi:hypothetical protein